MKRTTKKTQPKRRPSYQVVANLEGACDAIYTDCGSVYACLAAAMQDAKEEGDKETVARIAKAQKVMADLNHMICDICNGKEV